MGLGKIGFWMVRTALGIGVLYSSCNLGFRYGRTYERNKAAGKNPNIEVSRQVTNDFHDIIEELSGSSAETIEAKVEDNYRTQTAQTDGRDWKAELEKKYSIMTEQNQEQ